MADVRLMHTHFRGNRMFYFYDGETEVQDGVITLDTDHPEHVQRAWVMGYRLSPESGDFVPLVDALAAQTADDSQEEQVSESADSGGQSSPDNGIRTSEPESDGDTTAKRTRSSSSRRTRTSGKRTRTSKRNS